MQGKIILSLVLVLTLLLPECNPPTPTSTSGVDIYIPGPLPCTLPIGGEIPLSLRATNIPQDAKILWETDNGVISPNNKPLVQFRASDKEGVAVISVTITAGGWTSYKSTSCNIVAIKTEVSTSTAMETATIVPSVTPPLPTITVTVGEPQYTIAITEIMGNPCGEPDNYANKYIELYNYGKQSVNIGGLFLYATGQGGASDEIVSWATRSSQYSLGNDVVINSTVLQPKQYGVILSPDYASKESSNRMPYFFRKNTVILTIKTGDRIGNKGRGISTHTNPVDAVLLYEGKNEQIKSVISSYGLDDKVDFLSDLVLHRCSGLPLIADADCSSIQRKVADDEDEEGNWEVIFKGNPGSGPYQ